MKRVCWQISCFLLFSFCLGTFNVSAEESLLSKLNPFKKKEKEPGPVKVEISDTAKPSFTFPSWNSMKMPWSGPSFNFTPTWVSNPIKPPDFGAAWNRMNRGTKDFYYKSKTFFMPWAEPSIKQPVVLRPPTGSRGVYRAIPKTAEPEKKRFSFASFFKPKPESRSSKTVGEFLSQDRPKP